MSDELPEGWAWAKIDAVTHVVQNVNPESSPKRVFGYVDISSIDNSGYAITEVKEICGKDAPSRARRPVRPNDTLFCNVRTYLRNIALVPERSPAEVCSTGFTVLRPNKAIDPRYLFRYVLTDAFIERVTPKQTGTHYPATSDRVVRAEEIPLAPLSEQRRIVAMLEQLVDKVDACQKPLAHIPALLKRFRQSVLAAACSGRLTADWRARQIRPSKEWREQELSGICTSITDGDHQPPPRQPSGIPFLTIGNISSGRLDFSDTRFVSERYFSRIKDDRRPVRGDVLYTVVGATIGIPVLVDTDRPFCFQRHIALLRASNATTPEFLRTLLASPAVFREAWSRVTGTAQPTLPLGNLRRMRINLPPVTEQQEIVRRVQVLFALADQLEARLAKAQADVDRLTPSLLARAFRGELVPTEAELARQEERDYEPASVLLDRIQRERHGPAPARDMAERKRAGKRRRTTQTSRSVESHRRRRKSG